MQSDRVSPIGWPAVIPRGPPAVPRTALHTDKYIMYVCTRTPHLCARSSSERRLSVCCCVFFFFFPSPSNVQCVSSFVGGGGGKKIPRKRQRLRPQRRFVLSGNGKIAVDIFATPSLYVFRKHVFRLRIYEITLKGALNYARGSLR